MAKDNILLRFLLLRIIYGSRKAAYKKAVYLQNNNIFKKMGRGGYWQPMRIPSNPKLISIGNNVTVCADVKFFEHDIVHKMWNNDEYYQGEQISQYNGEIIIDDNVVLGGNSIILYNVHIGRNVLIAAGSVVTRDVEPFSIVGGNPAKKIGDTRQLYDKRLEYTQDKTKRGS